MTEQNTTPKFTADEITFVKTFFAEELSRKGSEFFNNGSIINMFVGEDKEIAIRKHADGGYWAKYRDEVGGYSSGDIEEQTLKDACQMARTKYFERKAAHLN